ncbi:MAG: hypothetical protein K2Q32_04775, partial [Alphaproteobacteria bacterium]|nr:hypothetical protein [Alphaproteobacteria bacterium]
MIQKQQKAPNIYGLLSSTPTSMLAAAIRELSSAVDTGHVIEPRTILGGILELIRTPAALDELPYVKIGYSAQSTLVNALTACLDPSQVKFKSKGILEADAKTRLLALNALIDIHDIVVDKNSSVIPSLGVVGRIIPKIIVHDMTDSKLMNAYHERLKGWAPFVAQFG